MIHVLRLWKELHPSPLIHEDVVNLPGDLIDNVDRWSGGNARTNRQGRVLYSMDNTMSFGRDARGHKKSQLYFKRSRRFSRRLVRRLRSLTPQDFRDALGYDKGPFAYLLGDD